MSVQRTLTEAKANFYPHLGGGMTLGSVCEHPPSGAWVVVIDVRDDGRVCVLNIDELPCDHVERFERAVGCVEHARLGRTLAREHEGSRYLAPPDAFEVLGPTHPDWQRSREVSR